MAVRYGTAGAGCSSGPATVSCFVTPSFGASSISSIGTSGASGSGS